MALTPYNLHPTLSSLKISLPLYERNRAQRSLQAKGISSHQEREQRRAPWYAREWALPLPVLLDRTLPPSGPARKSLQEPQSPKPHRRIQKQCPQFGAPLKSGYEFKKLPASSGVGTDK